MVSGMIGGGIGQPVLTVRQKILLAAESFSGVFSVEDLVVAAWRLYPEAFALRGYSCPDSNRVQSKLAGHGGLCALRWLESPAVRQLRVAPLGHRIARQLRALLSGADVSNPPEQSPEPLPPPLRDVVPEPVRSTRERVEERPLRRAARPRRASASPAPGTVEAPEGPLSLRERATLRELVTSATLRKSRRGLALTSADACALWRVLPASLPAEVRKHAAATESLLKRATQCCVEDSADIAYAFELFALHRLLVSRFPALLAEETAPRQ